MEKIKIIMWMDKLIFNKLLRIILKKNLLRINKNLTFLKNFDSKL